MRSARSADSRSRRIWSSGWISSGCNVPGVARDSVSRRCRVTLEEELEYPGGYETVVPPYTSQVPFPGNIVDL
jgi:hypothetical protein